KIQGIDAMVQQNDAVQKILSTQEMASTTMEKFAAKHEKLRETFRGAAWDVKKYDDAMQQLIGHIAAERQAERVQAHKETRTPLETFQARQQELQKIFPDKGEVFD